MTPKILFTATGILFLLHGIGFFLGASDIAAMGVPELSPEALNMAVGAHEIVAMFNIFLAFVLLAARNLEPDAAKKIAQGTALGYIVLFAGVLYHMGSLIPEQAPPPMAGVIFGALTLWACYIAFGKKEASAA